MIVQNIDTDLPGNTALPQRLQISLQVTEFSSRGMEKALVHFPAFGIFQQ